MRPHLHQKCLSWGHVENNRPLKRSRVTTCVGPWARVRLLLLLLRQRRGPRTSSPAVVLRCVQPQELLRMSPTTAAVTGPSFGKYCCRGVAPFPV